MSTRAATSTPYFKNLGTAFEPAHEAERKRFGEHLGPLRAWLDEHGWQSTVGRAPSDLHLHHDGFPDATMNFSGRYEGKQELVLRLKLPLAATVDCGYAMRKAILAQNPVVPWVWSVHKETAFVAFSVKRAKWLDGLDDRAAVEERLAEFARAVIPSVEAALVVLLSTPRRPVESGQPAGPESDS